MVLFKVFTAVGPKKVLPVPDSRDKSAHKSIYIYIFETSLMSVEIGPVFCHIETEPIQPHIHRKTVWPSECSEVSYLLPIIFSPNSFFFFLICLKCKSLHGLQKSFYLSNPQVLTVDYQLG